MKVTNVGVIGCGNISSAYIRNSKQYKTIRFTAFADLDMARARAKADEYGNGAIACTVEEMLADDSIQIILNITIPNAHYEVAKAALLAGKSVYNEKPLTISKKGGKELLALAREQGLRLGGAPDTFLGAGIQTCRNIIDQGIIGGPVAATAFMMCHGHESWHPDPEFYYQLGGGPMFDMGPYYLTTLVNLLGPVSRVSGSARISFNERIIMSEKKNGKRVEVEVPTHVVGTLDFKSGAIGTIMTSFDVWSHHMPCIENYGSKGSLLVPDPNGFEGEVMVWTQDHPEWNMVPLLEERKFAGRSLGLADMAYAIENDRIHRANGDMAYHVLDIMHAIHEASESNQYIQLENILAERPAAFFKDSDLAL